MFQVDIEKWMLKFTFATHLGILKSLNTLEHDEACVRLVTWHYDQLLNQWWNDRRKPLR